MDLEELIDIKSKEITRLHKICREKNTLLWKCLEALIKVDKETTIELSREILSPIIAELKLYINP